MSRPIDVLVVDDSAVTRQVITALLSREPGFEVRTAPDPYLAFDRMKQRRPDVVLLDLEMPRMHGLDFLRRVMSEDPLPVVICSAFARKGTEEALLAMDAGAVEVFPKPASGLAQFFESSAAELVEVLREAAGTRVARRSRDQSSYAEPKRTASALLPKPIPPPFTTERGALIVVGASIGGTDAIRVMLREMPPTCPPIAIVQHMRAEFVLPFVQRLATLCPHLTVRVAAPGDRFVYGVALVAPGGRHLAVVRRGDAYFADVIDGPHVSRHRPSVDVLFRSAATAAGSRAVGVLLTGMGDDGATGLGELRAAGAHTIVQDEATCVVFGMPKEAIQRGAAIEVAPLRRIASLALEGARRLPPR